MRGQEYEAEVEAEEEAYLAPIVSASEPEIKLTLTGSKIVSAKMPGLLIDIAVKPGDPIKNGQVLLILESMKMENEIVSPYDGVIDEIAVSKGMSVQVGDQLLSLG